MRTQSGGGYDSHKEGSWIMKSMTCTERIWGFERGKEERQARSDRGEQGLGDTEACQAFPTKSTT